MSEKQVKRNKLIEENNQLKSKIEQFIKDREIFSFNYNQLRSDFIQVVAQRNFLLKCMYCCFKFSKDILFTGILEEVTNDWLPDQKPKLKTSNYSIPLTEEVKEIMDDKSTNIILTANVSMYKDFINFSIAEERITEEKELEKDKKDATIRINSDKSDENKNVLVIHPMQSGEKH